MLNDVIRGRHTLEDPSDHGNEALAGRSLTVMAWGHLINRLHGQANSRAQEIRHASYANKRLVCTSQSSLCINETNSD